MRSAFQTTLHKRKNDLKNWLPTGFRQTDDNGCWQSSERIQCVPYIMAFYCSIMLFIDRFVGNAFQMTLHKRKNDLKNWLPTGCRQPKAQYAPNFLILKFFF